MQPLVQPFAVTPRAKETSSLPGPFANGEGGIRTPFERSGRFDGRRRKAWSFQRFNAILRAEPFPETSRFLPDGSLIFGTGPDPSGAGGGGISPPLPSWIDDSVIDDAGIDDDL